MYMNECRCTSPSCSLHVPFMSLDVPLCAGHVPAMCLGHRSVFLMGVCTEQNGTPGSARAQLTHHLFYRHHIMARLGASGNI